MISPGGATQEGRVGTAVRFLFLAVSSVLIAIPLFLLAASSPAGAATGGSTSPTAAAAHRSAGPEIPRCPPDCGRVAAGDPLLVPYLTANPGPGWQALPAAGTQSYVDSFKKNLSPLAAKGVPTNVVAGKWDWVTGQYSLMIVLVSSPDLANLHLGSLPTNAQNLCDASHGEATGRLEKIAGVPNSVVGTCAIGSESSLHGATVAAFNRGDVAVLLEITSDLQKPVDPRNTTLAAQQQFLLLPAGGVLVSSGTDVALIVFWIVLLLALVGCIVACTRRRGSWRGPWDAVAEGFGHRQLALGVAVVAVVGAMAFSMLDFSLLHHVGLWYESSFDDFWRSWSNSANMTFGGGYGHIFTLDAALETAPAWQVITAPIARLALGLSFPYPSAVLYPTAFWVAGPLFLSAMVLPLCGADRWLQYMGVTDLRRRLTVLGVMAITLPPIALDGHPEDLIALGAMLYGLVAALEGRYWAVGWWLGFALAFQFLAFLAVPLALVLLRRRNLERRGWLEAIVPMVVVPLVFLLVPLASQPTATLRQLIHQKVYDISGYITPTWNLDPGVAAFVRALVALAAIPAALLVARSLRRHDRDPANLVVWTLGLLFGLRVIEPELVPYFLCPFLALLAISAARAPWWRLIATGALAIWVNWWIRTPLQAHWSAWLILVAQLVVLAWLAHPVTPEPEPAPVEDKKAAQTPAAAPVKPPPPSPAKTRTA
jgi:hypothetical protein